MMISVSGKRGIGKTYMLAKKLYQRYQEGFFTISNFTHIYSHIDCSKEDAMVMLNIIRELGEFKDRGYELVDLDPRFIHSGVFIAIDEAHLIFSADLVKRYQSEPEFQDLIKFLAQARKADVEIWYSTQDPSKVDKNFRRYTEEYIRYVPVVPFYYKKMVLQKRPQTASGIELPPYYRREIRYPIPLFWEEHHILDADNPQFNYAMVPGRFGDVMAPTSTLQSRSIVRAGWMDPFPYKLYDSYQMLNMTKKLERNEHEFEHVKDYAFIPHEMKREKFPTIKNILGITPNDKKIPKRFIRENVNIPELSVKERSSTNWIKQPIEFLDDLAFHNQVYGRRARVGAPRDPAAPHEAAYNGNDRRRKLFFARQEAEVKKSKELPNQGNIDEVVTAE